ncbi:hypothetical protein ABPG75_001367 [Micractinium tetrahymenae]
MSAPKDAAARAHARSASGDAEQLQALLRQHPGLVDAASPDTGTTALLQAVRHGHADCLDLLLAAGADPNKPSEGGVTPLELAVQSCNLVAVQKLLAAGSDPNAGRATHMAATFADPACLEVLLAAGAAVSRTAPQGFYCGSTPLHCAAAHYKTAGRCLSLLLAAGADVEAVDASATTPLPYVCTHYTDPGVLQMLLDAGADPNAQDRDGEASGV